MPAVAQDAWDKRVTPIELTEPRWVRAIEIRPGNLKGRKIVHHAIAYLERESYSENRQYLMPLKTPRETDFSQML
jgi:hypothetical protein